MADKTTTETIAPVTDGPEVVNENKPKRKGPNGKQLSAVFTPEEEAQLSELRWAGRHDKISDVIKAAVKFYAEAKLPAAE